MSDFYDFGIEPAITSDKGTTNAFYDFGKRLSGIMKKFEKEVDVPETNNCTLAKYIDLLDSKKHFRVTFDKIDEKGTLTSTEEGVTLILPNQDTDGRPLFDASDRKDRSKRLLMSYSVTVKAVDQKNNTVTLYTNYLTERGIVTKKIEQLLNERKEIYSRISREAKESADAFLESKNSILSKASEKTVTNLRLQKTNEALVKGLKDSGLKMITVPAYVTEVGDDSLLCDIMGLGIPAKLVRTDWSYQFIGKLSNVVEVGNVITVCIKGYNVRRSSGEKALYMVTRLPLIENPWNNLSVAKDDIVKIKCVEIKAACWYGILPGTELEVYGEFAPERNIRIIIGEEYECHIYKCDPELRTIKVRPIKQIKK